MQGTSEPVASVPAAPAAGRETWGQKQPAPVFVLKIRGKNWKTDWKILKCAEVLCPYKGACL